VLAFGLWMKRAERRILDEVFNESQDARLRTHSGAMGKADSLTRHTASSI
jgi:hypothetical protein